MELQVTRNYIFELMMLSIGLAKITYPGDKIDHRPGAEICLISDRCEDHRSASKIHSRQRRFKRSWNDQTIPPYITIKLESIHRLKQIGTYPEFNGWRAVVRYKVTRKLDQYKSRFYSVSVDEPGSDQWYTCDLAPTSFSTNAQSSEYLAPFSNQTSIFTRLKTDEGRMIVYFIPKQEPRTMVGTRISVYLLEHIDSNRDRRGSALIGFYCSNTIALPRLPK